MKWDGPKDKKLVTKESFERRKSMDFETISLDTQDAKLLVKQGILNTTSKWFFTKKRLVSVFRDGKVFSSNPDNCQKSKVYSLNRNARVNKTSDTGFGVLVDNLEIDYKLESGSVEEWFEAFQEVIEGL